jgi:hypothetical protein
MKVDMISAPSFQHVLETYCANSVKKGECSQLKYILLTLRAEMCETLHINTEAISDKYLGLPAIVGADMNECFLHFVERIIQRINGWKENKLSIGERRSC